jgi:hypothetical protein
MLCYSLQTCQEFIQEQGLQEAHACHSVTRATANEFNRRNRLLASTFRAKLQNELRRLVGTDEGDTPAVRARV